MKKQRVVVLGGAGFIGTNFVRALATRPEFDVHATFHRNPHPIIPRTTWHEVNLLDQKSMAGLFEESDIVIQAAATTSGIKDAVEKPDYHVIDNVLMNSLILRETSRVGVRHFIFFSCTTMLQPLDYNQNEEMFDLNLPPYPLYFGVAWTKVYLEKLCEFYSRHSTNTKYTVVRHSNIYGPYDKFGKEGSHVFAATIYKVVTAHNEIEIWGNGSEKRDLLHVSDLITLVLKALERQTLNFRLYNCGSGMPVSIRELTELVVKVSGREISIKTNPLKPTTQFSVGLDCSLAKKELGWIPEVSLESGIIECMAFVESLKA